MPSIINKYETIISYLRSNPEQFSLNSSNLKSRFYDTGIDNICEELMDIYIESRIEKKFSSSNTIPDEAVSTVMNVYFDKPESQLERIKVEHQECMISENIVGELLERYLASILENNGWVWCSGEFIKATDFIKYDNGSWIELQVKNRNNTENSSSSQIRNNTTIQKWFRSFSKKTELNWENFPDINCRHLLSEDDFKSFMTDYLNRVKVQATESKKFNVFPIIIKPEEPNPEIRIYDNCLNLFEDRQEDEIKEKVLEKLKRLKRISLWRKGLVKLSDVPSINKRNKNLRTTAAEVNLELLRYGKVLSKGQVVYLSNQSIDENNTYKCTLYPTKNIDMGNNIVSLAIDDEDIKFYMFSNANILIQSNLNFTLVDNIELNGFRISKYKVNKI